MPPSLLSWQPMEPNGHVRCTLCGQTQLTLVCFVACACQGFKKGGPSSDLQKSSAAPSLPALIVKAVSGHLPPTSPAASVSQPFSAVTGKHFKADLPKPEVFSKISVDADIHRWLIRMQEYCTLAGPDVSIFGLYLLTSFLTEFPCNYGKHARHALLLKTALMFMHGKILEHGVFPQSVCLIMTGMSLR